MCSSARRAFLLLNGGCSQFGLSQPCAPSGSTRNVCFLTKTLPRVASEMALHVLAYNLTRVMNIMGIQPTHGGDQGVINP